MTLDKPTSAKTGSNYARFRRVAESLKVPDEHRNIWGDNLHTLLQKYGPLAPRRVARKLALLSDDDMLMACSELKRFMDPEMPSRLFHRILYRLTAEVEAAYYASTIAVALPTYNKLAPAGQHISKEFVKVTTYDFDHTSPLVYLTGRFPAARVNMLHGAMMQEFTPNRKAIFEEDIEWFGEKRDVIIPIWEHIVNDGSFTRDRVQALISGAESGARTLVEGAL